MDYRIQNLTIEQAADIYTQWIDKHFPRGEIKPLKSIQRMWNMGAYQALGMYEHRGDGTLAFAGYAFFVIEKSASQLLLDYLAITEEYRGYGAGSSFLKEMKQYFSGYKGILIETEDIEYAKNEEERRIRQKRDTFYTRNGAVRTGIKSSVYGVNYVIWNFPVAEVVPDEETKKNLENIYKVMVPGEKYDKFVTIQNSSNNL